MKFNLLISSCGRRVQLVECFRQSARELGMEFRVVGCDLEPGRSAAARVADKFFALPRCSAPEFVPTMLDLCQREEIHLVVPTIDPELPLLSRHHEDFKRQGTAVAISAPTVVDMAADKLLTGEWLREAGIPTPRTCSVAAARREMQELPFPVMLKPVRGSASIGARLIRDAIEVYDRIYDDGYLVQECISGQEYTVNLYFELAGGALRCAIPHRRIETRAGEVSKGETVRHEGLLAIARKIGAALVGARGCVCFQAIEREDGGLFVTDLNARFGGGYPLAHFAGATFCRWMLEEVAGRACSTGNDWEAGVTMLRYDAAVFVRP